MISLISTVLAQTKDNKSLDTKDVATIADFQGVFENIVGTVLGFAGIVLFLMLIAGGFRYITAGGDPKAIEGAKKTLTYAIAGIVLIAAAYLILLLIERFTGAPVTEFSITG